MGRSSREPKSYHAIGCCELMRVKSACNPTGLFPLSPRAARHCIAIRRAGEQQNSFGGAPFDELAEAAGPTAREARSPSAAASWSVLGLDPAPIARALGGDLGGSRVVGLGRGGLAE